MTKQRIVELRSYFKTVRSYCEYAGNECLDEIERLQEALVHYKNSPPPHPKPPLPDLDLSEIDQVIIELKGYFDTAMFYCKHAGNESLDEIERLQEALAHYKNSPPPHPKPFLSEPGASELGQSARGSDSPQPGPGHCS